MASIETSPDRMRFLAAVLPLVADLAVLTGFIGVLIVIRPGTDIFHPSSLLLLFSSVCYALYQIFTRMVANVDPPETTTVYSSAFGALGLLVVLPFVGRMPDNAADIVMFCGMGALGAAGHYCLVRALAYAPASIISPFQYFQMIGAVLIGYLAFDHFPDLATWIGASFVIAAGLYVGWSNTHHRR